MKIAKYSLILFSVIVLSSCNAPEQKGAWETITFNQSKPILVDINDGDEIREHGEQVFFEAKMSDADGNAVAQLIGMQHIADLPEEDGIGNAMVEERFTNMAIVFSDVDKIMISGAIIYPMNQRTMQIDDPQVMAIIGGTGKYKGIRGQVTTTRKAEELYTQVLEYRLD
jgi:hypothetical protein